MSDAQPPSSDQRFSLDRISTQWSSLSDPQQFILRYATAIRSYLDALLKNPHDAEEVQQEFLMRVVQHGFGRVSPDRGRFRDYLKIAVRNAALTRLRRKKEATFGDPAVHGLADSEPTPQAAAEDQWLADWRSCLLSRAWRRLEGHQRRSPGNLGHTVLRAAVEHPEDDSRTLANRVSAATGRPLKPEAFRKQLSRARHLFAEFLVEEVALTLDEQTPEGVEEELVDIGLMEYVRDFLPSDWRSRGRLSESE